MGTYIAPFDLRTIFIDYFLGTLQFFAIAVVIVEAYIAARVGMSNRIFMLMLLITSILFAVEVGSGLYFLSLLILGFAIFKLMGRFATP